MLIPLSLLPDYVALDHMSFCRTFLNPPHANIHCNCPMGSLGEGQKAFSKLVGSQVHPRTGFLGAHFEKHHRAGWEVGLLISSEDSA